MAEEQLVLAYYAGTVFSFERAQTHSPSVFGGPMMAKVSGIEHGPKPLHMIARLASAHFDVPSKSNLFDIPLIYGMCYDGCGVEYRVDGVGNIELLRLRPTQSSDDWPYRPYPPCCRTYRCKSETRAAVAMQSSPNHFPICRISSSRSW